jgi:superoxide dismutase, Cu-Zn family
MKYLVPVCLAATMIAGCGQKEAPPAEPAATSAPVAGVGDSTPTTPPDTAAAMAAVSGASVQLAATQGNSVTGSISVAPMGDGVHLTGSIQGLKANGEFGFHIHEKGDCSAPDASSAGAHFNPTNAEHGNPQGDAHHGGDLQNAKSDASGTAQVNAHVSGLTLGDGGAADVVGKAVVVHEKADDYKTQPSGDSGARVSCGVITAAAA